VAKFTTEVLEYEMGILFRHCGFAIRGNVVPECDIIESEESRRSVRKMGNDHGIWEDGQYVEVSEG
jgi:hypothetical protein